MKRSFLFLLAFMLMSGVLYAQSVKQSTKDTSKYKANDRLRTAGPKDGWKDSSKLKDASKKIKSDTVAVKPKTDSLKKRN